MHQISYKATGEAKYTYKVLAIGGAAMLELGLKYVTKDIDLVFRDAAGKARLLEAATSLCFELFNLVI